MLSYIAPTRDRPERLQATLDALGRLSADDHELLGGGEIIIVDNASSVCPRCPARLANGLRLRVIGLAANEGAAARNIAVEAARGDWVVMLDDDSHPRDTGFIEVLAEAAPDIAAIGAEIVLPDGRREAGGLPEVFIGCGVAIRRDAFLEAGGYDPAFHYYAEEYDLAAKLLLRGWRVVHDRRFRVMHEKTATGRDMDLILARLVRNNGWVAQRYAPSGRREEELREIISRYAAVAIKELAAAGFAQGMSELLATLGGQPRLEMDEATFDRFTGLAHARASLAGEPCLAAATSVAIVDEGKNCWAVRRALVERGVHVTGDEREADVLVVGTLSPGPMLDAWERRSVLGKPVMRPWAPIETSCAATR